MHIRKIEVEKFRGTRKASVEDLRTINLFFGPNNCGKTTLLEAAFLSIGISNPELAVSIHNFRNLLIRGTENLVYLFYQFDLENVPLIKTTFETRENRQQTRRLEIKPKFKASSGSSQEKSNISKEQGLLDLSEASSTYSSSTAELERIEFKSKVHKSGGRALNLLTSITVDRGGMVDLSIDKEYKEEAKGVFISASTFNSNPASRIENLIIEKRQDGLVEVLRAIDPRLKDITVGSSGVIYFDIEGIDRLMPMNVMGDGIRRVLSIIATIESNKNGVILIDEIENGLHFRTQEILWRAIINSCRVFNVQIIATTHSLEIMKLLKKELALADREKVSFYGFARRKDDELKTYQLGWEELDHAIENDIEIREL